MNRSFSLIAVAGACLLSAIARLGAVARVATEAIHRAVAWVISPFAARADREPMPSLVETEVAYQGVTSARVASFHARRMARVSPSFDGLASWDKVASAA